MNIGIMWRIFCACTVLLAGAPALASDATEVPALLPQPWQLEIADGSWSLPDTGEVLLPDDPALADATAWVLGLLREQGIDWQPVGATENAALRLVRLSTRALEQQFTAAGRALSPEQQAEAYLLQVDARGMQLKAADLKGFQNGLATVWQLAQTPGSLPYLTVLDAPEFAWRGLMLDSARHLQSVDYILRQLDWMALHKLNVFHWHLTDDQAWRLEIKAYPKLTEVGAYRVPAGQAPAAAIDPATGEPALYGGYYTQDEIRRVVAHATARGIMVLPEIDVPGHATAAIVAYPELGVAGHVPEAVPADWGIYHNVFNLEEGTFEFLETVLDEIVTLFPGPFIHLGGDEVVTEQWEGSERVRARMDELGIEALQDLQNYYVERLQGHLDQYERRVIGWDEILESDLPAHAAVMSWRGVSGAIEAAAKGHQTVLSPAPTLYFDHIQTAASDAPPGRGGVITVRDVYEFDPLPDTLLENREFVLGLQANLWTEHVRREIQAEYMTWPRAVAVAEVGWTTADQRSWPEFSARLTQHLPRLQALGIRVATDPQALTGIAPIGTPDPLMREDRELELCSNAVVLAVEDDAPLSGARESYLVDIMRPCWLWRDADLTNIAAISASVGQLPFNFQLGKDLANVVVLPPETEAGELVVQLHSCDGPVVATLPLAPAVDQFGASTLPSAPLAPLARSAGQADLCLRFRRPALDPYWALDWLRLEPKS